MKKHPHAGTPQYQQARDPVRVRDIHAPLDDIRTKEYQPSNTEGFVYFIQAEQGGPVKIGWSQEPEKRLLGIQTGHPYKLVIRRVIKAHRLLEGQLHARFVDQRLNGEWFEPVDALLEIIKTGETHIRPGSVDVVYRLICVDCYEQFEWVGLERGKHPPTICLGCADALEQTG